MNPPAKDTRIRVIVAEDQVMVLGALSALLEIEGDMTVVAQARNGKEALAAVLAHKPDVFITDIEMPELSGLDVAAELLVVEPASVADVVVPTPMDCSAWRMAATSPPASAGGAPAAAMPEVPALDDVPLF